ncbi:MAG TPA: hypothetical protein VJ485_00855 [archaeon]|jgi:hypothetical protein|nr:hypothetical protein [archaeon]
MHVITESKELSFTDLKIRVMEGKDVLGKYSLYPYRPWNGWKKKQETYHYADKDFFSYKQGCGVPRMLIRTASSLLQDISDILDSEVVHQANFLTPGSQKKLPHIFEDHGYELFDNVAIRIYTTRKTF